MKLSHKYKTKKNKKKKFKINGGNYDLRSRSRSNWPRTTQKQKAQKQNQARAQRQANRQARVQAQRQAQVQAQRQAQVQANRQARVQAQRQARSQAQRQTPVQAQRQTPGITTRSQTQRQTPQPSATTPLQAQKRSQVNSGNSSKKQRTTITTSSASAASAASADSAASAPAPAPAPASDTSGGETPWAITEIYGCCKNLYPDKPLSEAKSFDDIRRVISAHRYTTTTERDYMYNVVITNEDKEIGDYISESILLNGLIIKSNPTKKETKYNEQTNTVLLRENNDQRQQMETIIDTQYLPVKKDLYEKWWSKKIFYDLIEINKPEVNDYIVRFNGVKDSKKHKCYLDLISIKPSWESIFNDDDFKEEMFGNTDSISIYKKLSKIYQTEINIPFLPPDITVTTPDFKEAAEELNKVYTKKGPYSIDIRGSNLFGDKQVMELQQIGLFVRTFPPNPQPNPQCSYVDKTLCRELVGISPTVTNCFAAVAVLKNACVCYGSQIIPYGVTHKSTTLSDGTAIYRQINDELGIEVEHIAYFLQMMLFGGSSSQTWKSLINIVYKNSLYNTDEFKKYINDGFTEVDRSRKYLYDISTKIFNQWKFHHEVITFNVTSRTNGGISIRAKYNDVMMDTILCQVFFGKQFLRYDKRKKRVVMGDWKVDTNSSRIDINNNILKFGDTWGHKYTVDINIFNLLSSKTFKYYNDSSGTIEKITQANIDNVFEEIRKKTHEEMKKRENALNELYRSIDCNRFILITSIILQEMIKEHVRVTEDVTIIPPLKILKYNFVDALYTHYTTLRGGSKKSGGTKSRSLGTSKSEQQSEEMLSNMFNDFYKIFTVAQVQNPDFYEAFQYSIERVIYTDQLELPKQSQRELSKQSQLELSLKQLEPEPEPELNTKDLSLYTPKNNISSADTAVAASGGSKKKKPQLKKKTKKKHKKKYNGGRTVRTKRTGHNHKKNEKTKKKN